MGGVKNIHRHLAPLVGTRDTYTVRGDVIYYHYGCDGLDDRGWGCGYRTLQSLCSSIHNHKPTSNPVPSIRNIQQTLVTIGDKESRFLGSRDWIGSVEVALVIDTIYDVPCKIVHVAKGQLTQYVPELISHFRDKGTPVMMGGDSDSASKGIFGVSLQGDSAHLLVVDPHYYGKQPDQETLILADMLLWKSVSSFFEDSFYNLCLPQLTLPQETS